MNSLIETLSAEGNVTLARLKQLFRQLSKETHPDIAGGSEERFIRLRNEYEQALDAILSGGLAELQTEETALSPSEIREEILENLYFFALKVFGSDSEKYLFRMMELAKDSDPDLAMLLRAYYENFYYQFDSWIHNGIVFYAHNLWISSVRQLFLYYSQSNPRYRTILTAYLSELPKRAQRLGSEREHILLQLGKWLEREMDGEIIRLF